MTTEGMKAVLFMMLAGCLGDNETPEPDAGFDVDAAQSDAAIDAMAPDAMAPDADPCWTRKLFTCTSAGTVTEICVPYQGCAFATCDGMQFGYCGPG